MCSAAVWLLIGYWGCLSGIQWATPTHFKRRAPSIKRCLIKVLDWKLLDSPSFEVLAPQAAGEEFCLLDVRPFYNRLGYFDKVLKDLNVQVISLN